MAYVGASPANRALTSVDIAPGSVTLNDINFTDTPTNMNITGVINKHTMRLAEGVTVTGDVTISDNLILSKISDDGVGITLTNDSSTRTITGSGSIEASTLAQTPNASLTGMTGTVGSGVTFPSGHVLQTIQNGTTAASSGTTGLHTATPSTLPTILSSAITPISTSSKILVTFNVSLSGTGGSTSIHLLRDSTDIAIGDAAGNRERALIAVGGFGYGGTDYSAFPHHGMYLDSPSTVVATTYSVRVSGHDAKAYYVNRTVQDRNNAAGYDGRGSSWIILQEIA
jgi:hypothetical protein